MGRSEASGGFRAAQLALMVTVAVAIVVALPRPALAQGIVVSPSCVPDDDGDTTNDGILTVTIDASLNQSYDVSFDGNQIASNVASGEEFDIGPVVDGRHTLTMSRASGEELAPVTIDTNCSSAITVQDTPAGGVATGGGGTAAGVAASGESGPPVAALVVVTALLAAVAVVLPRSRGRLLRR